MTLETDIYTALRGLVSDRVYPDVGPDGGPRPYITYQQVGGVAINFVDPTVPSKKNGRFQFSSWADTRAQASALARQVEDALRVVASLQTTVLGAPIAAFDPITKLRGSVQDFSMWFDS